MKAKVFVTLKGEVLDPQGKAVANALRSLGFAGVGDVRVGKLIEIDLGGDAAAAAAEVKRMCEQLLANPVIEQYRFEVQEG